MHQTVHWFSLSNTFSALRISAVGLPTFVVVLGFVIEVACYLLPLRAILDVANHSKVAFYAAGYSKSGWIISIAVGTFVFFPVGWLGAAYYYFAVRPKVVAYEGNQLTAP